MTEQTKKPRNIKDFKARLGRKGEKGAVPPPVGGKPALPTPPGVAKKKGIAAPPFGASAAKKAAGSAAKKAAKSNPFVSSTPSLAPEQREVRIVIDDSAVDQEAIGKKQKGKNAVLIIAGALVGILFGFVSGSTNGENKIFNAAVLDGQSIYETVTQARERMEEAHDLMERLASSVTPSMPGQAVEIDFEALEGLNGLSNPLAANAFANKQYSSFAPQTVDQLFTYYNNVQELWGRIERVSAMGSGEERQTALSLAAAAAGNITGNEVGCALSSQENQLVCALGFMAPAADPTKRNVRPSLTSRQSQERTLFSGQDDLVRSPQNYVVAIDSRRSVGVLGQQATLFAEFRRNVISLKQMLDQTRTIGGQLEVGLGSVATLDTRFTL
jgi:hypothetical protein